MILSLVEGLVWVVKDKLTIARTYSKWYRHHAATMPLVAALAPRDVRPKVPNKTLRDSESKEPMTPDPK